MSKKVPGWIKNVLMFGGISTIALLISNNVAAQTQTSTTQIDSIVVNQDSTIYSATSNNITSSDTCAHTKVFNSGTTSYGAPLNNGNTTSNSEPCEHIKVFSGKNQNNNCIFYFSGDVNSHNK